MYALARRLLILLLFMNLVASCRATGIVELGGRFSDNPALQSPLTVVIWNVQKGINDGFQEDLEALIREEQPDLLLLQEAPEELAKLDSISGYFAESWSYPWPGGRVIGLITASRARSFSMQRLHSWWREFVVTAPKLSLATKIPLDSGEILLVINVHMLAFERWGSVAYRSQLNDLEKVMLEHTGPILLAGDFNTWSSTRLKILHTLAEELKLEEVTDFADERTTARMTMGALGWILGGKMNMPLDRVFVRGLRVRNPQVLKSSTSDHHALKVIVEPLVTGAGEDSGSVNLEPAGPAGHPAKPD